jgi:hypothetical protein
MAQALSMRRSCAIRTFWDFFAQLSLCISEIRTEITDAGMDEPKCPMERESGRPSGTELRVLASRPYGWPQPEVRNCTG